MNTLHLCYVILRSITEQKHQSFILEALKITILSWIQVLAVYFATSARHMHVYGGTMSAYTIDRTLGLETLPKMCL